MLIPLITLRVLVRLCVEYCFVSLLMTGQAQLFLHLTIQIESVNLCSPPIPLSAYDAVAQL